MLTLMVLDADGFTSDVFGPGVGVVHISYIDCQASDTELLECNIVEFYGGSTDHSHDVGVRCYESG